MNVLRRIVKTFGSLRRCQVKVGDMSTRRIGYAVAALSAWSIAAADDTELRDLKIDGWPCLQQPSGTAKTQDGIERNAMKNRSADVPPTRKIEDLDTAGFLKKVRGYDEQLQAHRRNELTPEKKQLLSGFEDQLVSLRGYIVLAYSGPPETTNCGDRDHHDWHLELFERPDQHHPQPGDPTPIICEITPHSEQAIYRSGARLLSVASFLRNRKEYRPTGHPAQLVRVTGDLMWDDEHNGTADVGPKAEYITPGNGFHHPWRSTAWEIHPVMKVEALSAPQVAQAQQATPASPDLHAAAPAAPTPQLLPAGTQSIVVTQPLKIKVAYGETLLPAGTRLPVVSADANSVRVRYLGQVQSLPLTAVRADAAPPPSRAPDPIAPTPAPATAPPTAVSISLPAGWDTHLQGGSVTATELQRLLSPHAQPAVDTSGAGGGLYGPVRYLMDARDAAKALGLATAIESAVKVATPGFPRYGLNYWAYDGNFEGRFNRLYLVTDAANRIACLQLVDEHTKPAPMLLNEWKDDWQTYNFVNTRLRASPLIHIRDESHLHGDIIEIKTVMYQRKTEDPRRHQWEQKEETKLLIPVPFARLILHCIQTGTARGL